MNKVFISVVGLKLNVCSVFSFSGTDGTISCVASYFVCNSIFSSIMAIAGDVNVRKPTNSPFISYTISMLDCFVNHFPHISKSCGIHDVIEKNSLKKHSFLLTTFLLVPNTCLIRQNGL